MKAPTSGIILATFFFVSFGVLITYGAFTGAFTESRGQTILQLSAVILVAAGQVALAVITLSGQSQDRQRSDRFSLGTNSSMANLAFERQVAFAERYASELVVILRSLHREGSTEDTISFSNKLYRIRQDYILWLPNEATKKLQKMESALTRVGIKTRQLKAKHTPAERGPILDEIDALFVNLLTLDIDSFEQPVDYSITVAINNLREIIGIDQLTDLRDFHFSAFNSDSQKKKQK